MSKEIGKFQIPATKTILGIGGFGHVFEGFYEKDTKIAIKRIMKSDVLQAEATILRKVDSHKNIIRYYGTENDANFV